MAVQKPYETFYLSENVRDDVRLEISAIYHCAITVAAMHVTLL